MLFLLLIFDLFRWDAIQAAPVPVPPTSASPTGTFKRSMFSIVWSCLSTVFICVWVSVHPNVPPRSQKRALWRRLQLMFWTIVVPELVLAWAVRQWYGAKMIANQYKGHGWTVMHGHFLIMGGFTLVHADINMPKKPTKPKLSLSFRFWRNAVEISNDRKRGTNGGRGGTDGTLEQDREGSEGRRSLYETRSIQIDNRSSSYAETRIPSISQPRDYAIPSPSSSRAVPRQFYMMPSPVPPSIVYAGSDGLSFRARSDDKYLIPKIWTHEDEEQFRLSEKEKQQYDKGKQQYEADKQRYEAEYQHYNHEKQQYDDEKGRYERSQRGEEDRWQYERRRRRFELVRQAYEEGRYLYEESRRRYQEIHQTYQEGRDPLKEIKRCYGEIRERQNGVEIQRSYEAAETLYQEQKARHDTERDIYEQVRWRHKDARQMYEEARKRANNTSLRNRRGGPLSEEREHLYEDSEWEKLTHFGEKKRLYAEEDERYEKARKHYKKENQLYDEATERYEAATARYTKELERMKEEASKRHNEEDQRNMGEIRRYEEENRRCAEEREHYEEARQQYEQEREVYEEERASEAVQHVAEEQERRRYETERQQYEDRRLQFEDEWCSEEQKLRRYETELHHYEEKLKEYEAKCRRYQLGPLSFEHFQRLVHESKIGFPKVTTEEIQDKSKADFLSKTIAILQTTWFLLQCIARGGQGLAITELELVTLALASLNAATYASWWNKPLGVQDPVRVYLNIDIDETQIPVLERSVSRVPEATIARVLDTIRRLLATSTKGFLDTFGAPFAGGGGLCGHYFLLIWVPCFLLFLVALIFIIFLSLFPLSIAVLLKIIKPTQPSEGGRSPAIRQLMATRIMLALRRYHYGLTSSLGTFSKRDSATFGTTCLASS